MSGAATWDVQAEGPFGAPTGTAVLHGTGLALWKHEVGKLDVRAALKDGQVDVRAVRAGEYVSPGQPVVTLINPDDLWVRADIEETVA